MWPTLFSLGPLKITTSGVILAVTFFLTAFWIWKRGKEEHFEEETLMDMVILVSLTGFIFARLVFVLLNLKIFPSFGPAFQLINYPGFSWFGGLIGGLIAFVLFVRFKKWDFFLLADLITPPLVLAQSLGNLANFFAGSFYGKETTLPVGLVFPGLEKPRHPTQLYLFLLYLLFLKLLFKIEKEYRFYNWYQGKRREAAPGLVFFSYFIGSALIQIMVAFFLDEWLYWKGIPLVFLLPGLGILAGVIGIYQRSGRSFKGELGLFSKAGAALARFRLKGEGTKSRSKFKIKSKKRIKVGKQV